MINPPPPPSPPASPSPCSPARVPENARAPATPRATTAPRTPAARFSPYPARAHTPPDVYTPSRTQRLPRSPDGRAVRRVSLPTTPVDARSQDGDQGDAPLVQPSLEAIESVVPTHLQLIVRPIVKTTIGQRDTSGTTLEDFVATGNSFDEIVNRLWEQYASRIRGRAARTEETWTLEPVMAGDWARYMQFKHLRHIVDTTRNARAWAHWLATVRGQTVTLLIFEYGVALGTAHDRQAFLDTCIRPHETDRAGATAEVQLRDVVLQLQQQWGSIYQAEGIVWRMWSNHVTRNLDRSTLTASITQPPPPYVAHALRPADARLEQHLVSLQQSGRLAVDVIRGTRADYRQLRQDWEAFGRRLEGHERNLDARYDIVMAFIRDVRPPAEDQVINPSERMENAEDHEHAP